MRDYDSFEDYIIKNAKTDYDGINVIYLTHMREADEMPHISVFHKSVLINMYCMDGFYKMYKVPYINMDIDDVLHSFEEIIENDIIDKMPEILEYPKTKEELLNNVTVTLIKKDEYEIANEGQIIPLVVHSNYNEKLEMLFQRWVLDEDNEFISYPIVTSDLEEFDATVEEIRDIAISHMDDPIYGYVMFRDYINGIPARNVTGNCFGSGSAGIITSKSQLERLGNELNNDYLLFLTDEETVKLVPVVYGSEVLNVVISWFKRAETDKLTDEVYYYSRKNKCLDIYKGKIDCPTKEKLVDCDTNIKNKFVKLFKKEMENIGSFLDSADDISDSIEYSTVTSCYMGFIEDGIKLINEFDIDISLYNRLVKKRNACQWKCSEPLIYKYIDLENEMKVFVDIIDEVSIIANESTPGNITDYIMPLCDSLTLLLTTYMVFFEENSDIAGYMEVILSLDYVKDMAETFISYETSTNDTCDDEFDM